MVLVDILTFFIALAVLIKGSDMLVNSASYLAKNLGVSEFIIGLTVVAIGTSVPELATGISASMTGNSELVLGTVLGSNIANIGLILGISAVISLLKIDKAALYRDGIFLLSASVLFLLMVFDRYVTSLEGLMLLVLFFGYIYHLIRTKPEDKFGYVQYIDNVWKIVNPKTYTSFIERAINRDYSRFVHNHRNYKIKSIILLKQSLIIIFALAVIIVSSSHLVPSASRIALSLGISETVIAFIMIAVGTSIPELIVSLTAIYRKLNNILVGNIIGSNITNIMLVGGVSAAINPISVDNISLFYMIPFMLFITLLFLQFIRTNWFIKKIEGIIFLMLYFSFTLFILLLT